MTSSPRSPERAAVGARAQRGRRQRAAAFEGRGDIYGQVSIASRLLFLLLTSAWWYARRISGGSLGGSLLCRPRPLRPFSFFPFYFSPLSPFAERRRSVDDALRRQAQEVSKRGILLRLFELPLKYFKKEIPWEIPARAAFFFFFLRLAPQHSSCPGVVCARAASSAGLVFCRAYRASYIVYIREETGVGLPLFFFSNGHFHFHFHENPKAPGSPHRDIYLPAPSSPWEYGLARARGKWHPKQTQATADVPRARVERPPLPGHYCCSALSRALA